MHYSTINRLAAAARFSTPSLCLDRGLVKQSEQSLFPARWCSVSLIRAHIAQQQPLAFIQGVA